MRKNKIVALLAVVTLVGFLGTLAAQENTEMTPSQDTSDQNIDNQTPAAEISTDLATAPLPVLTPPENLLTQMKVYPSF